MGRGSLESKMDWEAWNSYRGQVARCYNEKDKSFKYYGLKGIQVKYDYKEFKPWYRNQRSMFKKEDKVNIDRIDHDKNYCFENIKMVLKADNIRESNKRRSIIDLKVYQRSTGKFLNSYSNFSECSKCMNMPFSSISYTINHKNGIYLRKDSLFVVNNRRV